MNNGMAVKVLPYWRYWSICKWIEEAPRSADCQSTNERKLEACATNLLDNGEKYTVRHPEILVGNELVVTVDR
jgi:hypothetical protein